MSQPLLGLLDAPDTRIAIVGASDDTQKFGAMVYRNLKRKGYRVFPINPKRPTVDGDTAYPDLSALPFTPELVNLIVPPAQSLIVARDCLRLGIKHLWLQPGAEDAEVVAFLAAHDFVYLTGDCIMVRATPHPRNSP